MKSKLASFIMSFIMILIVVLFVFLGVILWQNFEKMQTSAEPENFQGNFTAATNTLDTNTITTPRVQDNPLNSISSGSSNSQNIDYSNVNSNLSGEYAAKVIIEDIYSNKSEKEFKIIVNEKGSN